MPDSAMRTWARALTVVILVASVDGYATRRFLMGVPISQWTSGEWMIFGIIAVTLLFTAVLVLFEIDKRCWQPKRRKKKRTKELKKAVDCRFLIPMLNQGRLISYAVQMSRLLSHHKSSSAIPSNSNTAKQAIRKVTGNVPRESWLGIGSWLLGVAIAVVGIIWAMITGIAGPIVVMAVFCTFTAAVYLALVPMAFRALQRVQDAPATRARPSADIWRHTPQLKLYEAACLLADIDPDLAIVSKPGDANGWYRALCEAVKSNELERISTQFDRQHEIMATNDAGSWTGEKEYVPYEETVISRETLKKFAEKREIRLAFLQ